MTANFWFATNNRVQNCSDTSVISIGHEDKRKNHKKCQAFFEIPPCSVLLAYDTRRRQSHFIPRTNIELVEEGVDEFGMLRKSVSTTLLSIEDNVFRPHRLECMFYIISFESGKIHFVFTDSLIKVVPRSLTQLSTAQNS